MSHQQSLSTAGRDTAFTPPEDEDGGDAAFCQAAGGSRRETKPTSWPLVSIKDDLPDRLLHRALWGLLRRSSTRDLMTANSQFPSFY